MFGLGTVTRIYVATGTTDMRRHVVYFCSGAYTVREQTARWHENLLLRWIERVGLCASHGAGPLALAEFRRWSCATDTDGVCDACRGH